MTALFAVQGNKQKTGSALLLGDPQKIEHDFTGNSSYMPGGARYLEDPYIIVSGVTFESNHSDQFGGALYVEPKGRIIGGEGLRFIGNHADLDGGATSYSTPRAETLPSKTTTPGEAPAISISARARLTPRSLPSQVRTASS